MALPKELKTVLVVDDDVGWHGVLRDEFESRGEHGDCPYRFQVDVASSSSECVRRIRSKHAQGHGYDVVVLDVRLDDAVGGLKTAYALGLAAQLGRQRPVVIMFTGYPTYESCVRAVRSGAWDYIVKTDTVGRLALEVVVDSAVEGLCGLDLQQELAQRIPAWFGAHSSDMQLRYCGQLVAIWWQPEVHVIASGKDAFELEERLESWRALHEPWEKPFIVQIPPSESGSQTEG